MPLPPPPPPLRRSARAARYACSRGADLCLCCACGVPTPVLRAAPPRCTPSPVGGRTGARVRYVRALGGSWRLWRARCAAQPFALARFRWPLSLTCRAASLPALCSVDWHAESLGAATQVLAPPSARRQLFVATEQRAVACLELKTGDGACGERAGGARGAATIPRHSSARSPLVGASSALEAGADHSMRPARGRAVRLSPTSFAAPR